MWVLTKASGSFVHKFQVYTGKRQDDLAEQNLGYHVVHDFSQNLTVKSHHDFSTTLDGIYSCAFERADSKELVTNNCNRSSIQGKERQSFVEKQCGCNSVERQKSVPFC